MLSQTAEYALRAVLTLADRGTDPMATQELALVTGAPPRYLAKVLQILARHKLVRSQRGVRGGFVLAAPSDRITVLGVVRAVDHTRRIERKPLRLGSHGMCLESLLRGLDETTAAVEAMFAQTTIADLLKQRAPTCRHEPSPAARASTLVAPEAVPC